VVFVKSDGEYSRGAALTAPGTGFLQRANELTRQFLAAHQGTYKILKYVVATQEHTIHGQFGGKGLNHVNYAGGKKLYEDTVHHGLGPVAETIAFGGNAVMRWRDEQGTVGRAVVQGGRDPLFRQLGPMRCEILHLLVSLMKDRNKAGNAYQVYVRTPGPVSEGTARRFTLELRRETGLPFVTVVFAADVWFLAESGFPAVYPFSAPALVPSHEEFRRRWQGACYVRNTAVACAVK
jgi:hypothetical protein